jgi:hypothetical protein
LLLRALHGLQVRFKGLGEELFCRHPQETRLCSLEVAGYQGWCAV